MWIIVSSFLCFFNILKSSVNLLIALRGQKSHGCPIMGLTWSLITNGSVKWALKSYHFTNNFQTFQLKLNTENVYRDITLNFRWFAGCLVVRKVLYKRLYICYRYHCNKVRWRWIFSFQMVRFFAQIFALLMLSLYVSKTIKRPSFIFQLRTSRLKRRGKVELLTTLPRLS